MVLLDNVRLFIQDHPEIFGDLETAFAEFLAHASSEAMQGSVAPEDDFQAFLQTTVVTSGEVARVWGKDRFDIFARELELPQHREIILRELTR